MHYANLQLTIFVAAYAYLKNGSMMTQRHCSLLSLTCTRLCFTKPLLAMV